MADRGAPDPLIAEARKRWQRCDEAEQKQRKRILLAKQFRAGDQWPSAIKAAREGASTQGKAAQPPRPCLVVDRLSQPVRAISNTIKNADFGFDVMPNGGGADLETAKIFKGYLRWVQNRARGESPVEWAADGAIEGGIGWFRLLTDYVHQTWDGDPNDPALFDQEVLMRRITNNLSVYCDPSAVMPTRSDAQFMFVTEDVARDDFMRRWPTVNVRGLDEFMSIGDRDLKGWVTKDIVRIAEYWRIVYENRTFYEDADGIHEGKAPKKSLRERIMRAATVKCDTINAVQSLEPGDWPGSHIPLIPIIGEELNVDGAIHLRGVIEEGMDAQRMVNYTYSGAMEIFALAPRSPIIAAAGQVENYKAMWDSANTVSYSNLVYDPIDVQGHLVPPPQLFQRDGTGIQAAVELMRTSEEAIKATTSTGDASLGNSHPNERSGRALQSLQAASDLANSNYPDNVRRALIYAAELIMEVAPRITRPGQLIQILGADDEPEQVMVGQPYQQGPNGIPQPAPAGVTPEMAQQKDNTFKFYDLNNGKYAVTATVGKANATKREEGAAAIGELIPHLPPEMAAVATPEYVEQLSFPGAQKMAEKLRKTLPPHLQDQDQDNPVPPQLQAMIAQMQQENQALKQAVATDQAKQQAQMQSAQIDAQVQTQKAQADAQVKMQIAQLDAQTAQMQADSTADKELALQVMKNAASIAIAHIAAASKGAAINAHAAEEAQALGASASEAERDRGMQREARSHEAEQADMDRGEARQAMTLQQQQPEAGA
jgi:hypothetical protein